MRLHCLCGAFLTTQPAVSIVCLPGTSYDWQEQADGTVIVVAEPIPPLPPTELWECRRCGRRHVGLGFLAEVEGAAYA